MKQKQTVTGKHTSINATIPGLHVAVQIDLIKLEIVNHAVQLAIHSDGLV